MRQVLVNSLPTHAPEKLSPPAFFIRTLARVALLAGGCPYANPLDGRGRPSLHGADLCNKSPRFRL